uniref:Endoribonuclease n=1 Tax=Strongyloides venezuelensis TaxID=75913 RepID=A0A0K0EV26_STRVS
MFNILLIIILLEFLPFTTKQQALPNIYVTDYEIIDIVNTFYQYDYNAARKNEISINYQGHTNLQSMDDCAPSPLFTYVDPNIEKRPTFLTFRRLMNNYNPKVGVQETITKKEMIEIDAFLTSIMNTTIAKQLFIFLNSKNHPYAKDRNTLVENLKQIWFHPYSRSRGILDSSGFEHVFMGELKNNEVSGLHNWYRFYVLESRGRDSNFDYKGYIIKRFGTMGSVKFSWRGYYKKGGSFFIATSPEFDFFTFTLCFLFRRGSNGCNIEVNGCPATITVHDFQYNNRIFVGSAYPNIGSMTEECKFYNAGDRK